jgi:hypothetical protein
MLTWGFVVFTGHLSSFPKIKEGASDHCKGDESEGLRQVRGILCPQE